MDKVKNIDEMPKKSPLSLQIDLKKFEKATEGSVNMVILG